LQLVSGEFNDEFFAGGDIRIGDIVLLVDSDTRVPEDCLSKCSGKLALLFLNAYTILQYAAKVGRVLVCVAFGTDYGMQRSIFC